jgi:DNA modification methylase
MIQPTENFGKTIPPVVTLASSESRPNFGSNGDLPRHRWYRFKEGFSAGLVSTFTDEYLPKTGGRLLDPFMGSGTTAVEGARLGHHVDGIETNPFMAFMAKVKTRDYSRINGIDRAALECLQHRQRADAFILPKDSTLVERKGLEKWLLNRSVAVRFEQLRTAIANVQPSPRRELLLFALLSSMEDVANARKDGKCWRYKANWKRLSFSGKSLDEAFAAQVIRFIEDIKVSPRLNGNATIVRGDARRDMHRAGQNDSLFDAILTSPPYLNSFDYTDIYRPEMLMMQAANNSGDLRKMRFDTLRSHVQVAWKPSAPLDIPLLVKTIRAIDSTGLWCGRIPDMVNAYFVDLDQVIAAAAKRLKTGGTAGFVVADSAYCGVVIPVGSILAEIFERRGFTIQKVTTFRQTRGNGHHQQQSAERLNEVMVVAKYRSTRAKSCRTK